MKKIFALFSLVCFVLITAVNAQTTTFDNKNQTKSNKVVITRTNTVKVDDNSNQTKTTTAPESQERIEGTKNTSNRQTTNQTVVSNKQCEKKVVTVQKKTNIVVPKK